MAERKQRGLERQHEHANARCEQEQMDRSALKPARGHEEELDLAEPLLDEKDLRAARERSVARLALLWSKRGFLARTAAAGLLVATLIAFLIPKQFTSTARLMPPDQGPGNGMAMMAALASKAGSLGSVGSELLGLKTTGDLFIGILQSRTVEDDLIAKFDLRKLYGARQWEDARKILTARTDISEDRKSEIITISVVDRSPQRAQQMAEEYIKALNGEVTSLNTSSAHRERVFLEARLAQVQKDLESAEESFGQFASKNTAINIEEQGKAMITAGATLEGQMIAAETELAGLRQIFTDNNVRVREEQARVDELKTQLRNLAVSDGTTGNQKQALPYPTIRQLPVLGVSYADLYRRMKVEDAVFGSLTQQYEAAKVEEAKETPSVKVLDAPNLPEKKSYPPRLLIMSLGMITAFAAAISWAFACGAWASADSSDARKIFVAQVWSDVRASLPWVARNGHNGTRPTHTSNEAQNAGRDAAVAGVEQPADADQE
jgi:uncharacterized protein involved in exopolysaccharide biosynthesis